MKINIEEPWCRHKHCKVRSTDWWLASAQNAGYLGCVIRYRHEEALAGPLACYCTCLTISLLFRAPQGSTPKNILFLNMYVNQVSISGSGIYQGHAG